MSTESFDKLLVFIGPRITYENTRLHLSLPPQARFGCNIKVRKYLFSHITVFQISLSVRYTNTIEVTKFLKKNEKNEMKLTDALLKQQIGEKRRHCSHLHLAGEVHCWR